MGKINLALGSQENAIRQLQEIQSTFSLKSLAEICDNGMDADATRIDIIRCKRKSSIEIFVIDNGKGVDPWSVLKEGVCPLGDEDECDMNRLARSICKSKKLKEKHSTGQFGIGMLGFPAISKYVEISSRCATSKKTGVLRMTAYTIKAETEFSAIKQDTGTKTRLYPVHPEIKQRFTAEKIAKYLGIECSENIRKRGTLIRITDKVQGKTIDCQPLVYKGERFKIKNVEMPQGNLKIRIHIAQQGDSSNKILLFKESKVLDDITTLEELNHYPWNSPLLEGEVKDRWITVSPSRRDVIIDKNLHELVKALRRTEPQVIEWIKEVEEHRGKKLDSKMVTAVKKTVSKTMVHLNPVEYTWFDKKGAQNKNSSQQIPLPSNMLVQDKNTTPTDSSPKTKKFQKIVDGPLGYIQFNHGAYDIVLNEMVTFKVTPWTKNGVQIRNSDIKYEWSANPVFLGSTEIDGDELNFTGNDIGEVQIKCKASLVYAGQKTVAKKSEKINISMSRNKKKKTVATNAGFLKLIKVDKPGEEWRCRIRYVKVADEAVGLEYNIGHRDYKRAEKDGPKALQRYIERLYGKQIVLHNFGGQSDEIIAERMIEIMTIMDSVTS